MEVKIYFFAIFLVAGFHYGSAYLEKVHCDYVDDPYDGYTCQLHITNPNGLDNFVAVEGTHLAGFGNDDVVKIERNVASYTTNIPSIICNTFKNLANFDFTKDFITEIGDNSLRGCTNLQMLDLGTNEIRRISSNAFRYNTNLWMVYLDHNYIADLPINLLSAARYLISLNLNGNSVEVIHSGSFGNLENLSYLSLSRNSISAFDERLIASTNLYSVEFTGNVCASTDIIDDSPNRDVLRAALQTCFNNYRDRFG